MAFGGQQRVFIRKKAEFRWQRVHGWGGVGWGGGGGSRGRGKEGEQHRRHPLESSENRATRNDLVVESGLEEGGRDGRREGGLRFSPESVP